MLSKKKQANKTSSFTSNLCGIPGVNVWNPKLMGSQVSTKNSGNKEGRSMWKGKCCMYMSNKIINVLALRDQQTAVQPTSITRQY